MQLGLSPTDILTLRRIIDSGIGRLIDDWPAPTKDGWFLTPEAALALMVEAIGSPPPLTPQRRPCSRKDVSPDGLIDARTTVVDTLKAT